MSSRGLALSVESLAKTYRIFSAREQATQLREVLRDRARRPFARAAREDFEALNDVTFRVEKGETVGVIGSNGAGKSTLLKILSRIVGPTSGRVEIHGRLGSLLEVGTGFNPELTGRENVFFNGAILGMKRREIARAFDSIVEFAEIGRFIDTPVKRYSSGMYVRLAFAVAAHLNSEILLVDEVLAVGDARFQQKSLGRMNEVTTTEGRTILFVSHSMPMVQTLCPRTIYLDRGRIAFDGETPEAIDRYFAGAAGGVERDIGVFDLTRIARPEAADPILRSVELHRPDGTLTDHFAMGEPLTVAIDVDGLEIPNHLLMIRIYTDTGVTVATVSTKQRPIELYDPDARQDRVVVRIPELPLVAGRYAFDITVVEQGAAGIRKKSILDRVEHAVSLEVVPADVYGTGFQQSGGTFASGLVYTDSSWEIQSQGLIAGATRSDAVTVAPRPQP
jgi:lipopolysaccharide transport system ATP-binding protein